MISSITEQWNNEVSIFFFCLRKKLDLEGIIEISIQVIHNWKKLDSEMLSDLPKDSC